VLDWQSQGERSLIGKCIPGNPYNIARYVTDNFVRGPGGATYVDACNAGVALGPFVGYAKPLQKTSTDTVGTSLQMEYQLPDESTWVADFIDLKSITGFRQRWDDFSGGDLDATPLDYLNTAGGSVEHWAVSQDLNVNVGFWDERIDLIVGGYYFQEQGDESGSASILRDMAIGNNPAFNAETYPTTVTVLNQVLSPLAPLPQSVWYGLGLANQPGNPADSTGDTFWRNAVRWGIGELNAVRNEQWSNESWAVYSHVDIEVVPDVTLQGGIRYTDETKVRAGNDQRIFFSQINATVPPFTITPPTNPPGTGTQRVVLDQSVDFSQWTPEAGIKWQISDNHMTYFRFANGWKSGGLRVTALTAEEAARRQDAFLTPYNPEEVYSYEIGVKTQWLDNQVFLNGTLFWNDYEDLQVTSLEPDERGIVSALINNAESAVTRGFEVEGSYLPDWADKIPVPGSMIAVTAGLGLTDAFYTQYTGTTQPLVYPQVVTDGCPSLLRGFSTTCNADIDQFVLRTMITATGLAPAPAPVSVDLSNNQFKNTPRFNMNASLTYAFEPTLQTELALRMDWSYRSTVYYTTINRADLASGPLNQLNLSGAFQIVPTDTQIVLWVKNVTDAVTVSGALNLGAALGADAIFYSQPRTFGMRIIQRF
jgi:outer membrane receptor protein involved in Fe transport